jgi:hypothetical protein
METKIGYKVVRVCGKSYHSAYDGHVGVRYRTDCATKRRKGCGPLGLFETLKAANLWVYDHASFRFFKAEYVPSLDADFWDANMCRFSGPLPSGTVFADKVKLLEKVK